MPCISLKSLEPLKIIWFYYSSIVFPGHLIPKSCLQQNLRKFSVYLDDIDNKCFIIHLAILKLRGNLLYCIKNANELCYLNVYNVVFDLHQSLYLVIVVLDLSYFENLKCSKSSIIQAVELLVICRTCRSLVSLRS